MNSYRKKNKNGGLQQNKYITLELTPIGNYFLPIQEDAKVSQSKSMNYIDVGAEAIPNLRPMRQRWT